MAGKGVNAVQVSAGMVSITMLGRFAISVDGKVISDEINRSKKIWNVVEYLIAHRERRVNQLELIRMFWAEGDCAKPVNALKTLLYRARAMLKEVFGEDLQPILAKRGAYYWNNSIPCEVDTERFEALCMHVKVPGIPEEQYQDYCRQALALYKGEFLPKITDQGWVTLLRAHYRELFQELARNYAVYLDRKGMYAECCEVCRRALGLNPLQEGFHVLYIQGLLAQGKSMEALAGYEKTTGLLEQGLNEPSSEQLRDLYSRIAKEESLDAAWSVIRNDLDTVAARGGVFVCDYNSFREMYRLESLRVGRTGMVGHIALLSVSMSDGSAPTLKELGRRAGQFMEAIARGLRKGDVAAKYSGIQYVIMLPGSDYRGSISALERVIQWFHDQDGLGDIKLSYKISRIT